MTEELKGWEDTCERFVAFLDIMGFKDRLQRDGHEKVKEMFESLRPTIEDIKRSKKVIYAKQVKLTNANSAIDDLSSLIYPVTFSDSIILFSKDKSDDSAIEIIVNAALIMSEALKNEIPMKGAIAFGEMTVDKTNLLYFGTPLIDAYELHKELQIYGVILHHTAQKQLNELTRAQTLSGLFAGSYSVPMKSGAIEHNLVNWVLYTKNPLVVVRKLYNSVSGAPRIYVDNTLKFVSNYQTEIHKLREEAEQKGILKKTKS
jgi:hypothetical protein